MDLPDAEPFHELALTCYVIAFVTYPRYPNFAVEVGALGLTLDAIAEKIEHRAAKAPRQRVVTLTGRSASVSAATATVQLAGSVNASGGVTAFPVLKVDMSATIAALGSVISDVALADLLASIAALGKAVADAVLKSNLPATLDALASANAEIAEKFSASLPRLVFAGSRTVARFERWLANVRAAPPRARAPAWRDAGWCAAVR